MAFLKICAQRKDLCEGYRIHAYIVRKGLLEKNPYLATDLINMYAKCGALLKAQKVLGKLPTRNVISWNVSILGYAQEGRVYEDLKASKRYKTTTSLLIPSTLFASSKQVA